MRRVSYFLLYVLIATVNPLTPLTYGLTADHSSQAKAVIPADGPPKFPMDILLIYSKHDNSSVLIPAVANRTKPAEPDKHIFIGIVDTTDTEYQVIVDSVKAHEIKVEDGLLGATYINPPSPKTPNETSFFYLGRFDEGSRVHFTIKARDGDSKNSDAKVVTITKKTLIEKFIKQGAMHRPKDKDPIKVNLLDLLSKKAKGPGGTFLVKVETSTTTQRKDKPNLIDTQTEAKWLKYKDIEQLYYGTKKKDEAFKELSWKPISGYKLDLPRYYRFRVRAGFSLAQFDQNQLNIASRSAVPADTIDADGNPLAAEDYPLGFSNTQFNTDSTKVVSVSKTSSEVTDIQPTLFLQIYPIHKKNLRDDHSLIKILFYPCSKTIEDFFTHSISLIVGTPMTDNAFKRYHLGFNFEIVQGFDISITKMTYDLTTYTITQPFDSTNTYFTNQSPISMDYFPSSTETKSVTSYGVNVDGLIFKKAFSDALGAIKKSIFGK